MFENAFTNAMLIHGYRGKQHVENMEKDAVRFGCSQLLILGEIGAFQVFKNRSHACAFCKLSISVVVLV